MAKEEKKSVALDASVYADLSKLAADLRLANPGGGFVSMSKATAYAIEAVGAMNAVLKLAEPVEHMSLQGYADVEVNGPKYLEPERPTKYRVKIPCYHYNTGNADNYSYTAKHDFDTKEEAETLCAKAREQYTMFKRYEKNEISFDRYQKWVDKFDCYDVEDGYIAGLAEIVEFYPENEME